MKWQGTHKSTVKNILVCSCFTGAVGFERFDDTKMCPPYSNIDTERTVQTVDAQHWKCSCKSTDVKCQMENEYLPQISYDNANIVL